MKITNKIIFPVLAVGLFMLSSCSLTEPTETKTTAPNISIITDSNGEFSVPIPENKGDYSVTFVCNNGYSYSSSTDQDNKILEPSNPKKACSKFLGWYKDKECTSLFTFRNAVKENTILYAKYETNYVELNNTLNQEYILSSLRIMVENYDITGFNRKTNESTSLGSGAIIYESNDYYYALTNNHVVYTKTKYQDIVLEDCFENEYTCEVLGSSNLYDLALIRFKKKDSLKVLALSDYDSQDDELVISFGEPNGLSNSITMGTIITKRVFEPSSSTLDKSNVTFMVYRHSCPIDSGSSGGALLDSNLKLVGINFASAFDNATGKFKYSYAIPSEKIREFIASVSTIEV